MIFSEAFTGRGPYETVDGEFTGLDNPDWTILYSGQADMTDDGLWFSNSGISDGVGEGVFVEREVVSNDIRSFVNRIEINGFQMGDGRRDDPPQVSSYIRIDHLLDPDLSGRQGVASLYLGVPAYEPEDYWGLRYRFPGTDSGSRGWAEVPKGENIALEIIYDDGLRAISYRYDYDIYDDVSPLTFGPFEYSLGADGPQRTELRSGAAGVPTHFTRGTISNWSLEEYFVAGDFNQDRQLTVEDVDLLMARIQDGAIEGQYDLDTNGVITVTDLDIWIHDLKASYFGDANLDGEFNSSDLVSVFTKGTYESGSFATWSSGDWNADGAFTSSDFVRAFNDGGYEQGPRPSVSAVPEPSMAFLLAIATAFTVSLTRRKRF